MTWLDPKRAAKVSPTIDTIRRWAPSDECVSILEHRGILTQAEATDLHRRIRERTDAAYASLYER